MKLSRREILNIPMQGQDFKTKIHFELNQIPEYMGIRKITDIEVLGKLVYDSYSKHLLVDVHLSGDLTLICSISSKDVPYPLDISTSLVYGFDAEDEKEVLPIDKDDLDLDMDFLNCIWIEIPSLVVADDVKELPHGQHWEVVSELEFRSREKVPDERLAKLKKFKFEEDE